MKNLLVTLNTRREVLHGNARDSMRAAARRWNCNYLEILQDAEGRVEASVFYQKLRLPDHLPDTRILYLDSDVVIRSDCPSPWEIVPDGSLGWVRSHHPSMGGSTWHVLQKLPAWAARFGVTVDIEMEYLNSGVMLFDLPRHRVLFEKAQQMVEEQGFYSIWEVADQGFLTVARKLLGLEVFWLPPLFDFCGEKIWAGWTAEMRYPIVHYCGPINSNIAIPRTCWDDLGPDRPISGTQTVRWTNGKPVILFEGPELPTVIREMCKVYRGVLVEVGCYLGGLTWWGAQIARDNYSEYHCVDSWNDDSDELKANEDHYRGFMENMREADLYPVVHRKKSVEAAAGFADGSIDFLFIDANHSTENCLADIDAWRPKMKPGGVMAGHDFCNCFGVPRAVLERFGDAIELSPGNHRVWIHRIPV
jgi:hypothetical protein